MRGMPILILFVPLFFKYRSISGEDLGVHSAPMFYSEGAKARMRVTVANGGRVFQVFTSYR